MQIVLNKVELDLDFLNFNSEKDDLHLAESTVSTLKKHERKILHQIHKDKYFIFFESSL